MSDTKTTDAAPLDAMRDGDQGFRIAYRLGVPAADPVMRPDQANKLLSQAADEIARLRVERDVLAAAIQQFRNEPKLRMSPLRKTPGYAQLCEAWEAHADAGHPVLTKETGLRNAA